MCYTIATNRSVVPLAFSAKESILIARITYTDDAVTRLVAVNTRSRQAVGDIGEALVGVSSMCAQFVSDTDMLVVAYSTSADHDSVEGTASFCSK